MALGMQSLASLVLIACFVATEVLPWVSAAGRAYPVDSETYIANEFRRINRRLTWDETNFLIDLSGRYSVCNRLFTRGPIPVDRDTPEGETIIGYVDYTAGSGTDVDSVKGYLGTIIDRWIRTRVLDEYIYGAKRFGCSVRPGCSGYAVTTCLFSPCLPLPTTTAITEGTTPTTRTPTRRIYPVQRLPRALAFTREQYDMAERATNIRWDHSHFLENLSGLETSCYMIQRCYDWEYATAKNHVERDDMRIEGSCGFSPNRGSTPDALNIILRMMGHYQNVRYFGCSLIPDCYFPTRYDQMYVVVSCLYQLNR